MEKYDFIIVGSGFGGSVSAMRLSQKGYKVLLLEKGKRYRNSDFPKTNWNVRKFIWAPFFRLFGIQEITLLNKMMILHGAGVGGGSLVYANTLMQPQSAVLESPLWPDNFSRHIGQHYQTAQKMLGVTKNQIISSAETALQKLAQKLNVEKSYHLTEVGICFSAEKNDPYFSGTGPERQSCTGCGACMIGCPVGAKNTLDKNYLFFAEKWGCQIKPETRVERIEPNGTGYVVRTKNSLRYFSSYESFYGDQLIISAGVLGTLKILFENKYKHKTLTQISDRLGENVRTNGESLCGATSLQDQIDYSKGIAIGSAIHTDSVTKIEPVRYPDGSDLMRMLAVPLTGEGNVVVRPLKLIANIFIHFLAFAKLHFSNNWAKRTIILLVMQSIEEKISVRYKRSVFNLFRKDLACDDKTDSIKSYMPVAQEASKMLADIMQGVPQNVVSEVLLGVPATAHILGGCTFGTDKTNGVINERHEIFGYPNLFVSDGSVIPVNLGVNPSLTITALTENFCMQFDRSQALSLQELQNREIKFSQK